MLYSAGCRVRRLASNRWRLIFVAFAGIYGVLLSTGLSVMAILWDEVPHLLGGLFLFQGRFGEYVGSTRYPPMVDLATAGSFFVLGPSVLAARLVSVVFALLTLWAVFELASRAYGPKVGLLASVLLAVMPGFIWVGRLALLEMLLEFFFVISMLFFFFWLRGGGNKALLLSGVALGLGFLTKFQALAAGVVMLAAVPFLYRSAIKARLKRLPLLVLAAVVVVLPWLVVVYQVYMGGILGQWVNLLQSTDPFTNWYSARFPLPVFYLIEMVWPFGAVHPISFFIYALGLAGLGLLVWRRNWTDKFFAVWFVVVYVFFTLVGPKSWRYVLPLFPVLAVSAAVLVFYAYGKAKEVWSHAGLSLKKQRLVKAAAVCLVCFTCVAVVFSVADAVRWVENDSAFQVPVADATHYVAARLGKNESVMVVCALNMFNRDMVRFYLGGAEGKQNLVLQYPDLPVDAYAPSFNLTELVGLCTAHGVCYLLMYEYGMRYPYFESNLTAQAVYDELNLSSEFAYQTSFGVSPSRIFVFVVDVH
jgi:4-amino-4-deoxy-L-arabinose transferase-like glycosyltransferase